MKFSCKLLSLRVRISWSRWLLNQRRLSIPVWSELTFHLHPLGNCTISRTLHGFYFFSNLLVLCSLCLSCKLYTFKGKSSIGTWDPTVTHTTSISVAKATANKIKLEQGPLQSDIAEWYAEELSKLKRAKRGACVCVCMSVYAHMFAWKYACRFVLMCVSDTLAVFR